MKADLGLQNPVMIKSNDAEAEETYPNPLVNLSPFDLGNLTLKRLKDKESRSGFGMVLHPILNYMKRYC